MTASRDRKDAAKVLGIALQAEYRALLTAVGNDDVSAAAIKLGDTFNSNIEFVIWILKEYGGMVQKPFERQRPALPKTPSILMN